MARITKLPEERRQEIIQTALILFTEKGYENTTIQDIAERMNVATGLCYRYFKSKQDIFSAASDLYAQQAVEQMMNSVDNDADAVTKLNAVIGNLLAYAIKHSEFEATYNAKPQIRMESVYETATHIADIAIPIVRQGQKENSFHCDDVENTVRFMAFGIINLIHFDMPLNHVQEHIQSFVPSIATICKNLLGAGNSPIGNGWENLIDYTK